MIKIAAILATGLFTAGLAMAQSSSLSMPKVKVKPVTAAEALALTKGDAPMSQWCDSLGFVWNLSGAGLSGRVIAVTGDANICGSAPTAGGLTLAAGLPLDVTATVPAGCFCNQFHQMVVRWDKASGVFVGDAIAFGGCDGTAPIQLGRC